MKPEQTNHYEAAFALWLRERGIPYAPIQQARRWEADGEGIKSFDFLLWPGSPHPVAAEVKGRTFAGASLAGLRGWIAGRQPRILSPAAVAGDLSTGPPLRAVFVFAFQLKQADGTPTGWICLTMTEGDMYFLRWKRISTGNTASAEARDGRR